MDRAEVIERIAQVLSGIEVPVSLGMPLGTALEPWRDLHTWAIGFGYGSPEQYRDYLEEVL